MITSICRCGYAITFTPVRPGRAPADVRHVSAPGQSSDCPK